MPDDGLILLELLDREPLGTLQITHEMLDQQQVGWKFNSQTKRHLVLQKPELIVPAPAIQAPLITV